MLLRFAACCACLLGGSSCAGLLVPLCVKPQQLTGSSQLASEASQRLEPRQQASQSSLAKSSKQCRLFCDCELRCHANLLFVVLLSLWSWISGHSRCSSSHGRCSSCCRHLGTRSSEIILLQKLNIRSPSDGTGRMVQFKMSILSFTYC